MAIKTGTAMFALAALSLGLAGCSGLQGSFPDVAAQNSVGSIRGSVYGGHAPIVGAHLFLLEATANGYATEAKSLLSASSTGTNSTYPVAEDTTTGSLTNGLYYITSDSNGAFNVTGDYTCDVGYPVYLYASAGSPGASSAISMTGISDTLSGGVYTYTFTAANMLYTGQSVQFSGASLGGEWATLNGKTQTVLATPTATSFKISTTTAPGSGANTSTGSATALGATNPAIVNLAMVGLCPGTGNFTNSVQSVYMNEVSTTAMAYAMSGFATDGLHIGTSSSNLIGLQNAALNAANLYNIQGGVYELAGNSAAGEGQIANQATPAGNGTAPQAELDTVANILAACVDSANTSTTTSAACNTLFTDATSTGTTSGTKPVNTAAAAFNMVHNPGATNVVDLWELPTGIVPFAPELTSAPKDFTAAITYTNLSAPGSIAIDASGDAFVPTDSTSGYVTKLSPQGAVLATSASGGSGFDSIAVAPNGNAYVAASGSNAVYRFTSALGAVSGSPWTSPTLSAPTSVIADSSSNVYVTDGGGNADIIRKFSSTGTLSASITNTCMNGVTQISLDASGYLWADSFANSSGCRLSNPSGTATFSLGESMLEPENVAVDSNGNGWVALESQNYIAEVTTGGSGAITNGGGLSSPTWVAIDGSNNIWVANNASPYALSEFNNAGTAITSCSGYQGGTLNTPSFLAIDASGDVWVPNKGSNSVTEIIGAATPVVTPLSAQKPGARP